MRARCRGVALLTVASVIAACQAPRPAGIVRPEIVAWQPVPAGSTVSLRGLSVPSADVAWASGEDGTVLRTVDGGASWTRIELPEAAGRDLRDIDAFDADRAVVLAVGSPARFWRTDDGGASWQLVHSDERPEVFFDAMAFADEWHGYAFADPIDQRFVVVATVDGGRTWTPLEGLPEPLPGEAGFAASGSCVAARGQSVWIGTGGGATRVLRSPDGGGRFEAVPVPMAEGGASRGVFSIVFRDLRNGIAVGGDYAEADRTAGTAAFTADGGRTWHAAPGGGPTGYRSGAAFLPGAPSPTCFAVGTNGIDVSLDGGLSWRRVGEEGYHAVAFAPDAPVGFAVGSDGRIARYDARAPLPPRQHP